MKRHLILVFICLLLATGPAIGGDKDGATISAMSIGPMKVDNSEMIVMSISATSELTINVPMLLKFLDGFVYVSSFKYKTIELKVPKGTKVTVKEMGE